MKRLRVLFTVARVVLFDSVALAPSV